MRGESGVHSETLESIRDQLKFSPLTKSKSWEVLLPTNIPAWLPKGAYHYGLKLWKLIANPVLLKNAREYGMSFMLFETSWTIAKVHKQANSSHLVK